MKEISAATAACHGMPEGKLWKDDTPTAPRLSSREILAQEIARKRAKIAARNELSAEAEAIFWRDQQARHVRSERAWIARKKGLRTAKPSRRSEAQVPQESRLWCKAMSLDAERDRRLSPGASACLRFIRALAEKGEAITKAGIAALMGRSCRQVQRYIADLREAGYFTTTLVRTAAGWITGQVFRLAAKVLPYFMRPKTPENGGKPGETYPSPYKDQDLKERDAVPIQAPLTG